jgi:hypothetical protein
MSWVCLKDETRKVRKHYRCTWCGEEICPGDAYQYSRGVFEGSMCTNRLHPECDKAAQEDFREWGEGFAPHENTRPVTAHTLAEQL